MKYYLIERTIPWFPKGLEFSHKQLKKWYKKEAIQQLEDDGYLLHTRTECIGGAENLPPCFM